MDWTVAVTKNRERLVRILRALVAMAGLSETRTHLRRPLHRAVLRLLRPTESAARRLIVIAARGLVVSLPKARPPQPSRGSSYVKNGIGTGIVLPRGMTVAQFRALTTGDRVVSVPAKTGFRRLPLADPLPAFRRRRRRPAPAERPFEYYEPLDATRLGFRLQAVGDVLDNLPAYAKRFARWKARRNAIGAENQTRDAGQDRNTRATRRIRRTSPLKPGRPPGSRKRRIHEVHDLLADLQHFAWLSLQPDDTS